MAVPFGFSVGDFLVVGKLIGQVAAELGENSEAAPEFQSLLIELEALKRALFKLHALRPGRNELSQLTSIRATALACQKPLEDFLSKITKFESRLGTFNAATNKWKGLPRRMQFRIMFKEDVKKLRATLASHVATINLLLMTQAVASISIAEDDRHSLASSLEYQIIEHRRLLEGINDQVDKTAKQQHNLNAQMEHHRSVLDQLGHKADRAAQQLNHQNASLDNIHAVTSRIQNQTASIFAKVTEILSVLTSGVLYLRDIAEQLQRLIQLCTTFTAEMRTAMATILNLFLSIQANLQQINGQLPARLYLPTIRFTTALGDTMALPLQLCQQWSTFSELLGVIFLGKPGQPRVQMGNYLIMNARGGRILEERSWQHAVNQDDHLSMSMVLGELETEEDRCPFPSCQVFIKGVEVINGGRTCPTCGRWSRILPSSTISTSNRKIVKENSEDGGDPEGMKFDPVKDLQDCEFYRQISIPFDYVDVRFKHNLRPPPPDHPYGRYSEIQWTKNANIGQDTTPKNDALKDLQMQLMLLEQQHKMARDIHETIDL